MRIPSSPPATGVEQILRRDQGAEQPLPHRFLNFILIKSTPATQVFKFILGDMSVLNFPINTQSEVLQTKKLCCNFWGGKCHHYHQLILVSIAMMINTKIC